MPEHDVFIHPPEESIGEKPSSFFWCEVSIRFSQNGRLVLKLEHQNNQLEAKTDRSGGRIITQISRHEEETDSDQIRKDVEHEETRQDGGWRHGTSMLEKGEHT